MTTDNVKQEDEWKIQWLVSHVCDLSSSIVDATQADLGQDCIKIVKHRSRFEHFLTGSDDRIVPITFEAWPSLSCNARCSLCTYKQNDARKEADKTDTLILADVDKMRIILSKMAFAGVNSIIWTGGGEPTLHPKLTELIRECCANDMRWGLFTHGLNLTEQLAEDLIALEPRFLRISINSWSDMSHHDEYRLGKQSYLLAKRNAILASSIVSRFGRPVGLGYALAPNFKSTDNLAGIVSFVTDVFEKSSGGLGFVAFRPKIMFYNKGQEAKTQPWAKHLNMLVELLDEHVVEPLRSRFGPQLRIDFKAGMFLNLADLCQPGPCLATPWASAIDHRGVGYILSELNGSPWPNSSYGDYSSGGFSQVWNSESRLNLSQKYRSGEQVAPAHHKLSHVDGFLQRIRSAVGTMTPEAVSIFYSRLADKTIHWPSNWDFL